MSDLTWVEINKDALIHNIDVISKKTDSEVMINYEIVTSINDRITRVGI